MLVNVMTKPPVNDHKRDGHYAHCYLGRHAQFVGRKYRRGKNRCLECGAFLTAGDGPPDPDRHLSPRERIAKELFRPSPLLAYLTRKAS